MKFKTTTAYYQVQIGEHFVSWLRPAHRWQPEWGTRGVYYKALPNEMVRYQWRKYGRLLVEWRDRDGS
jgi:hypothetical protein